MSTTPTKDRQDLIDGIQTLSEGHATVVRQFIAKLNQKSTNKRKKTAPLIILDDPDNTNNHFVIMMKCRPQLCAELNAITTNYESAIATALKTYSSTPKERKEPLKVDTSKVTRRRSRNSSKDDEEQEPVAEEEPSSMEEAEEEAESENEQPRKSIVGEEVIELVEPQTESQPVETPKAQPEPPREDEMEEVQTPVKSAGRKRSSKRKSHDDHMEEEPRSSPTVVTPQPSTPQPSTPQISNMSPVLVEDFGRFTKKKRVCALYHVNTDADLCEYLEKRIRPLPYTQDPETGVWGDIPLDRYLRDFINLDFGGTLEEIKTTNFKTFDSTQQLSQTLKYVAECKEIHKFAGKVLKGTAFLAWFNANTPSLKLKRMNRKRDDQDSTAVFIMSRANVENFKKFNEVIGLSSHYNMIYELIDCVTLAIYYNVTKDNYFYLGDPPKTEGEDACTQYKSVDPETICIMIHKYLDGVTEGNYTLRNLKFPDIHSQ
jgi:hypothetical protein